MTPVLPPSRRPAMLSRTDFTHSPMVVFYQLTRACDLACLHCRADAQPRPHPADLPTQQAVRLVRQLATFPRPPLLVLTIPEVLAWWATDLMRAMWGMRQRSASASVR